MLKSLLSSILIVTLFSGIAYSQCTPNTSITTSGITPDSATGLNVGIVGQIYNQVLQVRVPVDTVASVGGFPVTVPITSITLTSFTGLPPGLTYTCNPTNCVFPGGSNGCVSINGIPTTSGAYSPVAILTTSYVVFGFPSSRVDTVDYYVITINPSSVGLNQHAASSKFSLTQNIPNPFNDFSVINYSVPSKANVNFKVFNIIGKEVFHQMIGAEPGFNEYSFDGRDLSPGIYMYTMTFNNETISKRMVISRK